MEKRFVIDSVENREYMRVLREELLRFGHEFASPGGASYYLGDDGKPWTDRPRETWITSRMTHVYSIGSLLGSEGSGELAAAGLKGLAGELHDNVSGGWYAGITKDNEPLPNKQCYAHAFVILAASSAKLAGIEGADVLLKDALEIYDKYFWNEEEGLSADTWDTGFSVLDPYRGLNANMHTVEAFLAVADATGDDKYRCRAGRIIDRVIEWARANSWRIPEHFNENWEAELECNRERPADQFKPYGATPGHGIEWARLITQWAVSSVKNDAEALKGYIECAQQLFDRAVGDAWNSDGAPGIVYTTDWNGIPVVHDRMHWTLAEAINTSAVLYRVTSPEYGIFTGKADESKRYAAYYSQFLEYLEDKVRDHINGSWFHQLDSNNKLLNTVWPGKSDLYHAFQATLIPYCNIDTSVAADVYNHQGGKSTDVL